MFIDSDIKTSMIAEKVQEAVKPQVKDTSYHILISMVKLTVYIHTIKPGTVSFVDKEGAMHACAQAQSTAFKELTRLSGLFGNRYLCDDDRNTLLKVESFCRNKGLEYDIVDLGTMNFLTRLRLRIAGIRTPTICCGKERFFGILSEEDLQELVSAQ